MKSRDENMSTTQWTENVCPNLRKTIAVLRNCCDFGLCLSIYIISTVLYSFRIVISIVIFQPFIGCSSA